MDSEGPLTEFLQSDVGKIVLTRLFDVDHVKLLELYYNVATFYKIFNSEKVLDYFRSTYRIISPTENFSLFRCQYIIKYINPFEEEVEAQELNKYNLKNPFHTLVCLGVAVSNDDVEAVMNLLRHAYGKKRTEISWHFDAMVLDQALSNKSVKCIQHILELDSPDAIRSKEYLSEAPRLQPFFDGYKGNLEDRVKYRMDTDILKFCTGMLVARKYKMLFCDEMITYIHNPSVFSVNALIYLFSEYIVRQETYDEMIKLVEWALKIPGISGRLYDGCLYNGCTKVLAYLCRLDDVEKFSEHFNIVYSLQRSSFIPSPHSLNKTQEMNYNLTRYYTGIIPLQLGNSIRTNYNCITSTLLPMVEHYHKHNKEFHVSIQCYNQLKTNKDVLAITYINKHSLLKDI